MSEKNDWRLRSDVEHLKQACLNPTDGEEICRYAPYLRRCEFCFELVQDSPHQYWFLPVDRSCCICEECCRDFQKVFGWRKLDGWDLEWKGDFS